MLPDVLPSEAFAYLLVFTRIGAIMMVVPALGEQSIPVRVRLSLALLISFLIYLSVGAAMPAMPASPLGLAGLLIGEIMVGIMVGSVARLALSALHVAGSVIAMQTGLAAAQQFDPTQGSQGALVAGFLSLLGVTFIFVADLHHLLIAALGHSYVLFPAGMGVPTDDFASMAMSIAGRSFVVGLQLAAPFLVYGIVFYTGIGIIARLMPQLPIFFVAMPLNILAGFAIMMVVIGAMLRWFSDYFQGQLEPFLP